MAEEPLPDQAVDTRPWKVGLRAELAALMSRMTHWLFTRLRRFAAIDAKP